MEHKLQWWGRTILSTKKCFLLICDKYFSRAQALSTHMSTSDILVTNPTSVVYVTNVSPGQIVFLNTWELILDINHSSAVYVTNVLTVSSVSSHIRILTGDKPHMCIICEKKNRFVTKSSQIQVTYIDIWQLTLEISHTSVVNAENASPGQIVLSKHIRIHTGEYLTIQVSYLWPNHFCSSNLYQRMKIHTGDKPHRCIVCGKKFTESSSPVTNPTNAVYVTKGLSCRVTYPYICEYTLVINQLQKF